MRCRTIVVVILMVVMLASSGSGITSHVAADEAVSAPLLRLLGTVPDTPGTRELVQFGDVAAWHTAWNVPRMPNWALLELLPRDPHAYWMLTMPRQTAPPSALGLESLRLNDQQAFYGFDFFDIDRFIGAGRPPDELTVAEQRADPAQVGATLTASGYEAQDLASGWTLYSILDDYAFALRSDLGLPHVGVTGMRNRIALHDNQMIIARATPVVTAALDAINGDAPSLAADPAFAAAAQALDDPSLADTGPLVGAFLMQGPVMADPALLILGPAATNEQIDALRAQLGDAYGPGTLPVYGVAAFFTSHTPGATYLTLALVFPPGADAQAAAGVLAERLQTYVSVQTQAPLTDRWTFDRSAGVTANGLPVALVTMRVDDPPPAPEDSTLANASVWAWSNMIYSRDYGFLGVGEPAP